MVSAVDGAGKEHCHGCWRSGDVAAVDSECGRWCWEGALPWLLEVGWLSCGRWCWEGALPWLLEVRWLSCGRW